MGQHLEIERKFLIREFPGSRREFDCSRIDQGYFPMATRAVEIRLRRKDSKHYITIKAGRGRTRQEEEIEIPESKFRALWPLTREARISKKRYKIACEGRTVEVDVYQGPHRGLITAEVEFDTKRKSHSFRRPEWLGPEITGDLRYSNETMARRKRLPTKFK